jgi:hypothetical protein
MIKKLLKLLVITSYLGMSAVVFAQANNSKVGTSDELHCLSFNSGAHIDRNLNGDVMAVWERTEDYAIYWTTYDGLSNMWNPPQILMSGTIDVKYVAIQADAAGNFHAAFSVDKLIYHAKYDGISWSTPAVIQKDMFMAQLSSLVIDSNGYIWVSWHTDEEEDEQEYLFVARSEDNGATWSDPDTLGGNLFSVVGSSFSHPMLAAGPNGIVGTVYRERDYNISASYQQYFQEWNGTTWSVPERITDYDTNPGVSVYFSSLAYDSYGTKHAVFYTKGSDWPDYKSNQAFYVSNSGSSWTVPVPISQSPDGSVVYPVIRCDANDNLYAAWVMDTPPNTVQGRVAGEVFYVTSDNGGWTWTDPVQLSTHSHHNTTGVRLHSTNLSRYISDLGIDCLWADEDADLTTGDTYQIYYGRIPSLTTDVKEESNIGIPGSFNLDQNYPNPLNPSTTIIFNIPEMEHVSLVIYNQLGQKISALVNRRMGEGSHSIFWDGTDSHGRQVGNGVYVYKLEFKNQVSTKKLVVLK